MCQSDQNRRTYDHFQKKLKKIGKLLKFLFYNWDLIFLKIAQVGGKKSHGYGSILVENVKTSKEPVFDTLKAVGQIFLVYGDFRKFSKCIGYLYPPCTCTDVQGVQAKRDGENFPKCQGSISWLNDANDTSDRSFST